MRTHNRGILVVALKDLLSLLFLLPLLYLLLVIRHMAIIILLVKVYLGWQRSACRDRPAQRIELDVSAVLLPNQGSP